MQIICSLFSDARKKSVIHGMGNQYNPLRNAGDAFNHDPLCEFKDISTDEVSRALDALDELVEDTQRNLGE
jgi:hypothetical protein